MSPASSGSSPAFARLTLDERSLVRLVLEFLESRGLHISQIALERESGLINGRFSEDLLFLRQLIIDGQWDNALDFVEPLRRLGSVFDYTKFKFTILKHKYYELLCIKLEPGPLHDNDLAVEEVVACLKSLETASPSAEEYKRLCALLTLYRFSEHADFAHWNPSAARMECFQKIRPLVEPHMPPNAADPNLHNSAASPDRLVALLAKGLFYEAAVDYCQAQALGDKQTITRFSSGTPFGAVLDERRGTLGDPDLSLIGWLAVVSCEQFVTPFQQLRLDLQLDALK